MYELFLYVFGRAQQHPPARCRCRSTPRSTARSTTRRCAVASIVAYYIAPSRSFDPLLFMLPAHFHIVAVLYVAVLGPCVARVYFWFILAHEEERETKRGPRGNLV